MNIHPNAGGFVIASGAILGICAGSCSSSYYGIKRADKGYTKTAGLLWTAQGSLMLAYPTKVRKVAISEFSGPFSISVASSEPQSRWARTFTLKRTLVSSLRIVTNAWCSFRFLVGNGTYVSREKFVLGYLIGFLVLTLIGVTIPLLMANPNKMIRTDGTKVTSPRQPSWKTEIMGLAIALRKDPMVILLFPMFFAKFNEYNGALFNIRARSLNNLVYWMSQIVGSLAIGFLLDRQGFVAGSAHSWLGRPPRHGVRSAYLGIFLPKVSSHPRPIKNDSVNEEVCHTRNYTRESLPLDAVKMDIHDHGYAGRIWLYIFCGLLDAMWQTTAYWVSSFWRDDACPYLGMT
ncbi:major facilitator superfamily domain-containing protein [Salix suchowensis]|nr:major facilitator superfamily domain-containing protein [Salix suchowensis]